MVEWIGMAGWQASRSCALEPWVFWGKTRTGDQGGYHSMGTDG